MNRSSGPARQHAGPVLQGLGPIIGPACRVLILGSFPGQASLAAGHYYAHPRNAFWPIIAEVLHQPLSEQPFDARYRCLLAHGIGLWDTIAACQRQGSLDARIRCAHANELTALHQRAPQLQRVLFNGRVAARYQKLISGAGYDVRILPSTSPAHAAMQPAQKLIHWREALSGLSGLDTPGFRI